ncbi:hypothetical protein ACSQ67_016860 [Phaseolus vulgaris]
MLPFLVSSDPSTESDSLIKIRFPNRIHALTVLASLFSKLRGFRFHGTSFRGFSSALHRRRLFSSESVWFLRNRAKTQGRLEMLLNLCEVMVTFDGDVRLDLSFHQSTEEAYKELPMDGKDFVALKELAIELKIGDAVLAKLGVITPPSP